MTGPATATAPHAGDAFTVNWPKRIAWTALAIYCVYAISALDIDVARIVRGMDNASRLFSRMFPPNIESTKLALIYDGMVESIQIAILATSAGVALSLPIGLAAARNLSPAWLAWKATPSVEKPLMALPAMLKPLPAGRVVESACTPMKASTVSSERL